MAKSNLKTVITLSQWRHCNYDTEIRHQTRVTDFPFWVPPNPNFWLSQCYSKRIKGKLEGLVGINI